MAIERRRLADRPSLSMRSSRTGRRSPSPFGRLSSPSLAKRESFFYGKSGSTSVKTRHPTDSTSQFRVFVGPMIHSTWESSMTFYQHATLVSYQDKILCVDVGDTDVDSVQAEFGFPDDAVYDIQPGEFLMPGLIDGHIHAPQYANSGIGIDLPMMQWLYTYTYPLEARFSDTRLCEDVFRKVIAKTLRCGTTSACYLGTTHRVSAEILADVVAEFGQRAVVGKVSMDRNGPEYYVEFTNNSVEDTRNFVEYVYSLEKPHITPMVCPQYPLSCSKELMTSLGKISSYYKIPICSHISQSVSEVQEVKRQFKEFATYMDVFEKTGLLTDNSILVHGVHLTPNEMYKIKLKEAGIIHCPTSNSGVSTGIADVRQFLSMGLKVGLGSDVSGGWTYNMLNVSRNAVQTSKVVSMIKPPGYRSVNHREAFMLATLGAARVLGIDNEVGNFEVGKQFDAILVNARAAHGLIDVMPTDTLDDMVQRFIYLGDDRNVKDVYIAGKHVVSHA